VNEVRSAEVDTVEACILEREGAQQSLFLVREQALDPIHPAFLRRSRCGHLAESGCESHRPLQARIVPAADGVCPEQFLLGLDRMPPPDRNKVDQGTRGSPYYPRHRCQFGRIVRGLEPRLTF
jgi:hypothetical protein